MTKINCTYLGGGQTELIHEPTGAKIITDLPPDNGGEGRLFSPTDLLASAVASCILTIMAKMAKTKNEDFKGASIEIDKVMYDSPRRVGELALTVTFPAHFTPEMKERYRGAIHGCPVHQSLRPDIKTTVNIK